MGSDSLILMPDRELSVNILTTETADNLRFNVLNHELVPLHELLDSDDSGAILKSLGVTKDRLPQILVTDPSIKVISAQVGDVVRVTRRSKTAGHHVVYRLVVGA